MWVLMSSEPEGIRLFGPFDNEDECIEYLRRCNIVALAVSVTRARKWRKPDATRVAANDRRDDDRGTRTKIGDDKG
jgi:hypothetical protein